MSTVEVRAGRGRCAVAAVDLPVGNFATTFSGAPFAACLLQHQWAKRCASCFCAAAERQPLLRCSRCRHARYCNARCQGADWQWHKHECAAMPRLAESEEEAVVAELLLAGRCLWRRHVEPHGPAAQSFDDLVPGTALDSDPALGRKAVSLGLVPPGVTAARVGGLLAAFRANNFGVLDSLLHVVGAACYPTTALLNHSCAPNCVLTYAGNQVEVRTLCDVAVGTELCHSYVEICQPTVVRQRVLAEGYGFACRCSRCVNGLMHGGRSVDDLMTGGADRGGEVELERPLGLLRRAAAEENLEREAELVQEALGPLRRLCHPCSLVWYSAEGTALGLALARGELAEARECCKNAVQFLEAALAHCPRHPLLALQRFTLADLHEACGDVRAALATMRACAQALEATHGRGDELRQQSSARLEELQIAAARL